MNNMPRTEGSGAHAPEEGRGQDLEGRQAHLVGDPASCLPEVGVGGRAGRCCVGPGARLLPPLPSRQPLEVGSGRQLRSPAPGPHSTSDPAGGSTGGRNT